MVLGTRSKLALSTLTALVVGFAVVTVAFEAAFENAETVLHEALTARCVARASRLATDTAFPVAAGLTEEAATVLEAFLRETPQAKGAAILDRTGRTLVARGEPVPHSILERLLRTKAPIQDGEGVWAAAPLVGEGGTIGWVVLLERGRAAQELRSRSRLLVGFTQLAVLGLVALTVLAIGRRFARPIERMASLARRLAEGDLAQETLGTQARDEVGQLAAAVDQMAEALRQQVGAIKEASGQVHAEAGKVLGSTRELAGAARDQVAAVGGATVKVRNAKDSGEETLQSARRITATARESVTVAHEGTEAVDGSIDKMRRLVMQVEVVAGRAQAAVEALQQVDGIVADVNEIAEQSHVLSVNAGLEAARAGEFGKGFSVVAREVAALAQGSLGATSRVHARLEKIRSTIEDLARGARDGRASAEAAMETVERAGTVIRRLGDAIEGTATAAQDIERNATNQVADLAQVGVAIGVIDSTAARHLESAQQAEGGCSRLETTAGQLEQLVAHYRLKVAGEHRPPEADPTTQPEPKTMRWSADRPLAEK
jgi:methyl-accepting chemotaxis protein